MKNKIILILILIIILLGVGYIVGKKDSQAPTLENINNSSPMSTELPQYISAQSGWPPSIKNSAQPYESGTCYTEEGEMEKVTEKIIGGNKYCVSVLIDGAAGSRYGRYTYMTVNGIGTKRTDFILRWPNCQNYNAPEADICQKNQDEFLGNLDALINNLMEV